MPRQFIKLFLLAVTVASTSFGGVVYEFSQVTHSDIQTMPSTAIAGRGILDGEKSRFEFSRGAGLYKPGNLIISTNGNRSFTVVDLRQKAYSEVNVAAAMSELAARNIVIKNLKVNPSQLGDHPSVAGYPTDHYRVTSSYDITVTFGDLPLTQHVEMVIDSWTTNAFGGLAQTVLSQATFHTGNPQIDQLMDNEASKMKGFVLRQSVTVTTEAPDMRSSSEASKIFSPVRKQTSEMLVTSITKKDIDPAMFNIPAGLSKLDRSKMEEEPAVHMLDMQPSND